MFNWITKQVKKDFREQKKLNYTFATQTTAKTFQTFYCKIKKKSKSNCCYVTTIYNFIRNIVVLCIHTLPFFEYNY